MPGVVSADPRPQTTTELLRLRAQEAPGEVATFHRSQSGAWVPTTWSALWQEVQKTAATFRELGFRPGDRLAILARTCREWQLAELGANLAGGAVVGIDAHAAGEQITWILEHANVAALLIDGPDKLARIPTSVQERLKFTLILQVESGAQASNKTLPWGQAMTAHTMPVSGSPEWVPRSTDPVTVIYTSGTTGLPKGIEYSHEQLMRACWAMLDQYPDLRHSRAACWLPMAALFQRMMNLLAVASESTTYFVEDPREIMAVIADIRPTVFTAVPRFYEKLHDGIQERLAAESGAKKRLVQAALTVGAEWSRAVRSAARPGSSLRIRHAILDRLVLRRIRATMGGEIKWMISGSAAAPVWLLEFFHSIGLLVLEAYGITENPVPVAANRPQAYRFGSVGKPFLTNQVRLAEDGEVLVTGSAMFRGYLEEGLPTDRFTSNGFYRTGDYGRFDPDGFLYLTGRVAEIIKTTTGRRVSPVAIEAVYRQSRYVDQIVVVGNNRPHLVALIVLNTPSVEAALARAKTPLPSDADVSTSGAVTDLVKNDLDILGEKLARHEQVRAFTILPAPLSVESGEITSSLKLRRERIEARHLRAIEKMYGDGAAKTPAETKW